jgi:hypothetical protein
MGIDCSRLTTTAMSSGSVCRTTLTGIRGEERASRPGEPDNVQNASASEQSISACDVVLSYRL